MATRTTIKKTEAPTARKTTRTKVEAPMIVKPKVEQPVKAGTPTVTASQPSRPTREAIERRAYEIYASRGYAHGRHDQDWLQAERELNKK